MSAKRPSPAKRQRCGSLTAATLKGSILLTRRGMIDFSDQMHISIPVEVPVKRTLESHLTHQLLVFDEKNYEICTGSTFTDLPIRDSRPPRPVAMTSGPVSRTPLLNPAAQSSVASHSAYAMKTHWNFRHKESRSVSNIRHDDTRISRSEFISGSIIRPWVGYSYSGRFVGIHVITPASQDQPKFNQHYAQEA